MAMPIIFYTLIYENKIYGSSQKTTTVYEVMTYQSYFEVWLLVFLRTI